MGMRLHRHRHIHIHINIHIHTYATLYIYIYRERERERDRYIDIYIYYSIGSSLPARSFVRAGATTAASDAVRPASSSPPKARWGKVLQIITITLLSNYDFPVQH